MWIALVHLITGASRCNHALANRGSGGSLGIEAAIWFDPTR